MITWIRALLVARRLELRDRGNAQIKWVKSEDGRINPVTLFHVSCNTRVRIGIKRKETVHWCWRCEQILSIADAASPPPGVEDDNKGENQKAKVIPIFGRQKR